MERVCIAVALVIGFVAAALSRWVLGPDGVSYLDVGDLWLKGDFANAANGYWNPIYPILIAVASKLVGGGIYEPVAAHAVNLAVYSLNLFLFARLLRRIRRVQVDGEDSDVGCDGLFTLLAYALFVWCHVTLIDLASVSPDIVVVSATIAASICLVRLVETDACLPSAALLGVALALGYLTKAVMFVAAPFFLVAALLCSGTLRRGIRNAVLAAVVFLVVSAPYIALLSRQQGHLTYSESGKLAYSWMVNRTREYFHWQGAEADMGTPAHATRQLLADPEVFEFGDRPGTYPPWFDPSYWHVGLKVRVDVKQQIRAVLRDLRVFFAVFFQEPASIVLLVVFSAGVGAIRFRNNSLFRRTWPLLIPAIVGCGIYVPVFVLPRHLAPFILLLYLVALWNTWPAARRHLPGRAVGAIAAFALIPIVYALADSALRANPLHDEALVQRNVAIAVREFGLEPGDRIAIVGRGCDAVFARMAKLKVVAEAYREPSKLPTWVFQPDAEARAVEALKRLPVKAIIRDTPVAFDSTLPWKSIAGTKYSILLQQ